MTANKNLLIVLVILLACVSVWFVTQKKPSTPPIRHVVLISMDTIRADYLSCYGYEKETTPNIDALAAQGYLFRNTITPIPLTLPAHTSMLTGTIPPQHGKHDNIDFFDIPNTALPELLKKNGYQTAAFVGAQVLNARHGLKKGFDNYDDHFEENKGERRAEEVNKGAFEWLEKHSDNPIFLFLHYYDPHAKYNPPEPFATKFKESPYAGEIAYTDHCIGEVIAKLKSLGMYESTLIIVTGDHGEMLGEHGEDTHMYFIYQSAIKVPMIYKLPGSNTPQRIDDAAGIIDIVPTVCDLLDIEPPSPIQGKKLTPYFSNKPPENKDRYLFSESLYPTKFKANSLLGLTGKQWKYIQTTRPELYDIQKDPGELTNLVETEPHRARILRDKLAQTLEQTITKRNDQEDAPLDAESIKRLESLGYLTGSSVEKDFTFDQSKTDPKDMIGYHEFMLKQNKDAQTDSLEKQSLDAATLKNKLGPILGQGKIDPKDLIGLNNTLKYKAQTTEKNGDTAGVGEKPDASISAPSKGLSIPDFGNSAKIEQEARQLEKTLELMAKDKTSSPAEVAEVHSKLGFLYVRLKKFDLGISQIQESLKLDPEQPGTLNALTRILMIFPNKIHSEDPSKALVFAKKACELTQSKNPQYLDTLAAAYAANNNFSEAIKTTEKALVLAKAKGDKKLINRLQKQLDLYKKGMTK
ncbi:MAG: sulfatase-like hydrolase/transferase [Phycisphaerae bacterium]|nr:sulfatase-like hydrolase/transferase [Phycisphaerae bacterium]